MPLQRENLPLWMRNYGQDRKNQTEKDDYDNPDKFFLTFKGNLKYCDNVVDVCVTCEKLLKVADKTPLLVLGFDLEWPVLFGGRGGKTALMQICPQGNLCYLFHIFKFANLPKALIVLLRHPNVRLTGLNIRNDIRKLARDFKLDLSSVIENNLIELVDFANERLNLPRKTRWSLASLTLNQVGAHLDKTHSVRASDWSKQLSPAQVTYAATDAYASLLCYKYLSRL